VTLSSPTTPTRSSGLFVICTMIGVGCLFVGFVAPQFDGGESLATTSPTTAAVWMIVYGGLLIVGAFGARRSAFLAGVASGIAAVVGATFGFAVALVLFLLDNSGIGIGIGTVGQIGAAAALLTTAVVGWGQRDRRVDGRSVVSIFGILATLLTVIGALVPSDDVSWEDYTGFATYPLLGVSFLVLILAFVYVGVAGFVGGWWGVGVFLGPALLVLVSNLAESEDEADLELLFGVEAYEWSTLTEVAFGAMLLLFAVHVLLLLTARSAPALAAPPQWAPDPFGRHELRYFDGIRWSEHVSDRGAPSIDPAVPSSAPPGPASSVLRPPEPLGSRPSNPVPPPLGTIAIPSIPPARPLADPAVMTTVTNPWVRDEPLSALAAQAPSAPAASKFVEEHDGQTVRRSSIRPVSVSDDERTAVLRSVRRGRTDLGQSFEFRDGVVLGRDPSGDHFAGLLHLRVHDPSASLSKTHLVITVDDDSLFVEELGSSNGSAIVSALGLVRPIAARERVELAEGSSLQLGDRVITIEPLDQGGA
jgi:hypothetical protein